MDTVNQKHDCEKNPVSTVLSLPSKTWRRTLSTWLSECLVKSFHRTWNYLPLVVTILRIISPKVPPSITNTTWVASARTEPLYCDSVCAAQLMSIHWPWKCFKVLFYFKLQNVCKIMLHTIIFIKEFTCSFISDLLTSRVMWNKCVQLFFWNECHTSAIWIH